MPLYSTDTGPETVPVATRRLLAAAVVALNVKAPPVGVAADMLKPAGAVQVPLINGEFVQNSSTYAPAALTAVKSSVYFTPVACFDELLSSIERSVT
jgi:hypothetical protein